MMQEGRIHPRVATIAPGTPAIFKPTEVAELTASQMHLYLALLFRRDYFAPVRCIPIWLFCSTGIISASQIHPCLALLFRRDYFRRLNSSLSCTFSPQRLFQPAEFIPALLFCSTGIISASQIHPRRALLFHRDYFNRLNASLSGSFVPQGLFRPTECIPSLEGHHWKAIAENISARPFRQFPICTVDFSF